MTNKECSPFTPGNPVPSEFFVGRTRQLDEIIRYVDQALSGKQESVFVLGDRGIGKSSLTSFLRNYVTTKKNMLGIHVFCGGTDNLRDLARRVFDELLRETRREKWYEKIAKLFGNTIKEIGLFGISVSFRPPAEKLEELVDQFPIALANLMDKIKEDKAGLFIALDDINGLANEMG